MGGNETSSRRRRRTATVLQIIGDSTTDAGFEEEAVSTVDPRNLPYGFFEYPNLKQSNARSITPIIQPNDSSHIGRNVYQVQLKHSDNDILLCHIPTLLRWSEDDKVDVSDESYGGSAAALLAMHHFNTGDASVVAQLEGIHERCDIRLTTELVDTNSTGILGTQRLLRILTRPPTKVPFSNTTTTNSSETLLQPCAVLGSSYSSVTRKLATVTGVYDLPQISSSASSVTLDDREEYPLFARTHPSDLSMAQMSVDYLAQVLKVRHFAVIYIDNAFGDSYHTAILDQAALYNSTGDDEEDFTIASVSFREAYTGRKEIEQVLSKIDKGYHYFLGVFLPKQYNDIMESAVKLGLAGRPDRFWMFNGAVASLFVNGQLDVRLNETALYNATYGTAILHDEGGLRGVSYYEKFLNQWDKIANGTLQDVNGKLFLDYVNDHVPDPRWRREAAYFDRPPSHIAAFSYDAVVALGLAACLAQEQKNSSDHVANLFTGVEHHAAFLKNQFYGATGNVMIEPGTLSRMGNSTFHVVSNILPFDDIKLGDDFASFRGIPTMVYDTDKAKWVPYKTHEFVYASGTLVPPQQLPDLIVENHNASEATRIVCLALSAWGICLAIGFMLFTFFWRNHRNIVASQPMFLIFACLGALLMASSIIPATFDDSIASVNGCSFACAAKFWLLSMGFSLSFAILFSKLWRVNRLMHNATRFRHVKVRPQDVLVPCVILMGVNLVVLTIWSVFFPPEWHRVILDYDNYGRPNETSGKCHYGDNGIIFIAVILAINGCALVMALVQAYHARVFTTKLSESKYIGMITVCIFQACFIGVPILFLVDENAAAVMFVFSGIVSIICCSLLTLLFVPKIKSIIRDETLFPESRNSITIPNTSGPGRGRHMSYMRKSSKLIGQEEINQFNRRLSSRPGRSSAARSSSVASSEPPSTRYVDLAVVGDMSSSHQGEEHPVKAENGGLKRERTFQDENFVNGINLAEIGDISNSSVELEENGNEKEKENSKHSSQSMAYE